MGRIFGCGGCGCGFLTVLLIAVGAYVAYLFFFTAPEKPTVAEVVPAATNVPAPTAAAQFDAKVATAVVQTKSGGSKQPVRLVLTEEELAAKVAQAAGSAPGAESFQNIDLKIKDGLLVVSGQTNMAGRDVPVEAEVKLTAVENELKVEVTTIKTGGLPIPVAGPIQDMLADQLRKAIGEDDLRGVDLGFDVQSVRLADGQLEIEGITR
ncbi:MAG: LmeA family phospholipid-binding protein [Chloroflexota bacterium]